MFLLTLDLLLASVDSQIKVDSSEATNSIKMQKTRIGGGVGWG